MKILTDKAYQELGRIIFDSGVAEAFNIYPDQEIDYEHPGIRTLINFIAFYADHSVVSDSEKDYLPSDKTALN
jgi:hypothetical protein